MNRLFYGDNLDVLRRHIGDESVDLVYLDPPFNSDQDYNVLFAERDGTRATAQIKAFEDTWEWGIEAERAYQEIVEGGGAVASVMVAFRSFLGNTDMMAYLAMMAPRLVELRRVMKDTASIYLHCDPTASHYLKMLMDAIFRPENFQNEIIWKRTSGHSDAARYGRVHDTILFYSKSSDYVWNEPYQPYDPKYVEDYYRYKDADGRMWMSGDLSASGLKGGGYEYEWKGVTRVWRCPPETMEQLDKEGRVYYTKNGIARIKRYLDESQGIPAQDVWTDIEALRSWHKERLDYPTQKPESLLDRIIEASTNPDQVVLDPFCGCGTAVASAQRLGRQWIGIDITHLAIGLIKSRLRDRFGDEIAKTYQVTGEPTTVEGAVQLASEDRFQFQAWALGLVGARHEDIKKGADLGIDGRLYFHDEGLKGKTKKMLLSVKSGALKATDVRDLRGVIEREKAEIGVLIALEEPTKKMIAEAASAGFYESPWGKHPRLQILTVKELLDGKRIDYPPGTNVTLRRAPRAETDDEQQPLV